MKQLGHYTSRQLGQEIAISQKLKPGRGGKLDLTPDRYEHGYQAAGCLSILKNVEVVCLIAGQNLRSLSAERPVEHILGEDGQEIRPGGGTELWTDLEVPFSGDEDWIWLEVP